MLNKLMLLGYLIAMSALGASTAHAAPPVECGPPNIFNPRTGECSIIADPGGGGGGGTGGGGGGAGGGGTGGGAAPVCSFNGSEVPCSITSPRFGGAAWWVESRSCYVGVAPAAYQEDSVLWQGNYPQGAIYFCEVPPGPVFAGTTTYQFWSLTPPAGPASPPDPQALARQAVTTMQLSAIDIGMGPEPRAGSVGLVGMPNWMWVDSPTESTWGPITRSASAGGYTVTATAKVAQVNWDMGDGQVVTCGAGTAYQDSYGLQASPTCGHRYTRQGSYTVRATSHWVITWSGIGQSGTITMDLTDSAPVTIGEAQVLKQ